MSDQRLCYNCQFMYFDTGSPGYSEYTPGSMMAMYCQKGHWELYDDVKLAECLETAINCSDYKHSDKAKALGIPAPVFTYKEVPTRCSKCKTTQLHYYKDILNSTRDYTHCPSCSPIHSVLSSSGDLLMPTLVTHLELITNA